jgi:hypothetical protein
MARDKLITIRIEGEKREAFNNLAKSQNTDTASLLYDFISGCLDGKIDIGIVTGRGNWIDNQIDSDRLDKLETTTQRLDERVGQISKKLNDWIEAFSDRLSDCDRELSEKITSLEHRLNALSIQLNSQEIDRIDTDSQLDSQQDSQQENPDMGTVATVEAVTDKVESAIETVESVTEIDESDYESVTSPIPNQESVETAIETVEAIDEPDKGAIGPVPGEGDSVEPVTGKGMTAAAAVDYLETKKVKVSYASLHRWRDGVSIPNTSPQGRDVRKHLTLRDKLYYPIN